MIKLFSREGRKFYFFCAKTAGYLPHSTEIFRKSFIHKSIRTDITDSEKSPVEINNERLEFLGDAVIETVVTHVLFDKFPTEGEGTLSKLRSNMVCRTRLNEVSFALGLDQYTILTSRKDLMVSHIPGDVLEAFVGAIYLDGGMSKADRFIRRHIASEERIAQARNDSEQTNYKTELIGLSQKAGVEVFFNTHRVDAPTESNPKDFYFETILTIGNHTAGTGKGRSKKIAEQEAAQQAMATIKEKKISLEELAKEQTDAPKTEAPATEQPTLTPPNRTIIM